MPLLGGLRVLTRTGGLARCLPFSLAQLKISADHRAGHPGRRLGRRSTAPAYLGFGDGADHPRLAMKRSLMAIATAAAGLLAAIRWTQAKGPDFGAPMVSTPAGRVPARADVQRVPRLRRLPDRHRADAARRSRRCGRWPSAAIAALILLNSMDAESMRARQAEQQRQLDQAKKQRAAASATQQQKKR